MNHENPTPLRVGATGTLNGWRVRVAGRLVMGVEEGSEIYYWSEYYLVDNSGNSAMLVFEETEDGPEWKLFREFVPAHPLTAQEAASKRVGDTVNLDGTPTPVTLVGESKVFQIEGRAPEGVERGDVASYFNVDTGSRMLVASWTADEIEFYEGLDAPADSVADAFGFPRDAASGAAISSAARLTEPETQNVSERRSNSSSPVVKIVLAILGATVLFATYSCFAGSRPARTSVGPNPAQPAPTLKLVNGARGSLAQHTYIVDGQAVVDVARVSGRHTRREYQLRGDTSDRALLVNGLSGGTNEWHLLLPVPAPPELTPYEAATKRKGAPIAVNDRAFAISDLFRATALQSEGRDGGRAVPDAVQYGFVAREAEEWLVARWTENQIQFLRGTAVPEADVLAALGRGTEKTK